MQLTKQRQDTSLFEPFEKAAIESPPAAAARVRVTDAAGRCYFQRKLGFGKATRFAVRGSAGTHRIELLDADGGVVEQATFKLQPATSFRCSSGPYAELAGRIRMLMERDGERRSLLINGRLYRMLVTWGRDHVHTLKSQKYFMNDVTSGMDYWLESQEDNGMFWDCIHPNPDYPGHTWFGEALGEGFFRYDDDMKYIVRRIPVEADCEFLYTEGVWYAWKASGDDAWMARQLPRLEKALTYNTSHPDRWSEQHQLVRRSMCMDSWDFVNPLFCNGDHRCINRGDPQFLFHSDNSGVYASHWRMAEMYEHLGDTKRASELRTQAEAFRKRANRKLFFGNVYGHMIPETLDPKQFYATVGDERKRMSLSTGYTINRRMPTHDMAVKIIREYQRRGKAKRAESFAEWWTMDPPYEREQWPPHGGRGCPRGEYMNGAICTIIAGEIAKAAFDHGCEEYGVDILRRVWELSERDGGKLHQVYRRLPDPPPAPPTPKFTPIDLRQVVNRGLRDGAHEGVEAWTGEGGNDMRNLPTGRRKFGPIEFEVVDPKQNAGKAVLRLDGGGERGPRKVTVAVGGGTAQSIYFMHTLAHSAPRHSRAGQYTVHYADGRDETIDIRNGYEVGLWWGISDVADIRRGNDPVNRATTRVAWRGANAEWKNVGLHMYGWDNPRPEAPITAITLAASETRGGRGGGLMVAAISLADQPVAYETNIRSYGLPDNWAQAAVFYAIAEGLVGIADLGRAFSRASIAPRWAASESDRATVCLHYPASDGYCMYDYRLDRKRRRITLDVTGSFEAGVIHCLLPGKAKAKSVRCGRDELTFRNTTIEQSRYVDIEVDGLPEAKIVIQY